MNNERVHRYLDLRVFFTGLWHVLILRAMSVISAKVKIRNFVTDIAFWNLLFSRECAMDDANSCKGDLINELTIVKFN